MFQHFKSIRFLISFFLIGFMLLLNCENAGAQKWEYFTFTFWSVSPNHFQAFWLFCIFLWVDSYCTSAILSGDRKWDNLGFTLTSIFPINFKFCCIFFLIRFISHMRLGCSICCPGEKIFPENRWKWFCYFELFACNRWWCVDFENFKQPGCSLICIVSCQTLSQFGTPKHNQSCRLFLRRQSET